MSLRWIPYVAICFKVQSDVFLSKIWTITCDNFETVQDRVSVLISNRQSHMGFWLLPTLVTLNGVTALILRYFTKSDSFGGRFRHSGWRQTCRISFSSSTFGQNWPTLQCSAAVSAIAELLVSHCAKFLMTLLFVKVQLTPQCINSTARRDILRKFTRVAKWQCYSLTMLLTCKDKLQNASHSGDRNQWMQSWYFTEAPA